MTKVSIISGFLGAGKTTFIKKLLEEALKGEKIVLIENEFGEIGIDGGFLQEAGVEISEMNSGCICCSLVGDFGEALKKVMNDFTPDRIIIEPSGVGKLSDVVKAVEDVIAEMPEMQLVSAVTVADATKCKVYLKNFGEFYENQVENAGAIIMSRTQKLSEDKLTAAVALLREHNENAAIVTTPWDELTGAQLLAAMEQGNTFAADLMAEEHHHHDEHCSCGHDHHHHEHHDHDCGCGHHHEHEHHHHDEHCGCGHDHHEHHDHHECCGHHHGDEGCHEHHHGHTPEHCGHEHHEHHDCGCDHHHHDHHHHEHGEHCSCGHDHRDHHHHHADEVFTSWGVETARTFSEDALRTILTELDSGKYGIVLRAKGIVPCGDGKWLHFDYVPEEHDVRFGSADYTGRLCVIGSKLDENALKALFEV